MGTNDDDPRSDGESDSGHEASTDIRVSTPTAAEAIDIEMTETRDGWRSRISHGHLEVIREYEVDSQEVHITRRMLLDGLEIDTARRSEALASDADGDMPYLETWDMPLKRLVRDETLSTPAGDIADVVQEIVNRMDLTIAWEDRTDRDWPPGHRA